MDSCPADIIAHILEYIPLADLGNIARSLGLVSKYHRRVAKPFEFRALVIMDSEQLKATLGRIETEMEREGEAVIDVRHLLVCEEDRYVNLGHPSDDSLDEEDDGATYLEDIIKYVEYTDEFRKNAAALVRNVHTTLITLSITQRFRETSSGFGDLCIISGLFFPRLEKLILKHSREIIHFDPPTAPLLRYMHLNARHIYYNTISTRDYLSRHPLLEDIHFYFENLTHLILRGGCTNSVDDLLEVLCGSQYDAMRLMPTLLATRSLPEQLIHVGLTPRFPYDDYVKAWIFCKDVRALCIDGLDIHKPEFGYGVWREDNDEVLKEFEGLARECW